MHMGYAPPGMDLLPNADNNAGLLQRLFPNPTGADVSTLRAPPGSFTLEDVRPLIEGDLVRFDTRTGISCQGSEDWALELTTAGMGIFNELQGGDT
jgi:hypothetical protein